MFLLYNCLLTILAPFWLVWMILRVRVRKQAPNWDERQGKYGITPRTDRKRIWLHAVSVGEFIAAKPVLKALRVRLPDYELVVSVTTSSAHTLALRDTGGLFDHLIYAPIDVARFTLSAMQKVRPSVLAIMETELWFNLLWAAKTFECETMLINGRISEKSFRTSRLLKFFYRNLFKNVDRCLMQGEADAGRIEQLGASNIEVFGNCKYDQAAGDLGGDADFWRTELGLSDDRPVIVIGSTRGVKEEKFVLDAIEKVGLERVSVIHAPRHLESVPDLSNMVRDRFGDVALRTENGRGGYLLLDTYGELGQIYSVADIVIVGGGFDDLGGQNLIQPLAQGKPVLHGPHMQNFKDIASAAEALGASEVCATPDALAVAIEALLNDPAERARRRVAAKALVASNVGASERYAEAIAQASERVVEAEKARSVRTLRS